MHIDEKILGICKVPGVTWLQAIELVAGGDEVKRLADLTPWCEITSEVKRGVLHRMVTAYHCDEKGNVLVLHHGAVADMLPAAKKAKMLAVALEAAEELLQTYDVDLSDIEV